MESVADIYNKRFDPRKETYAARFSVRTPSGEGRVMDDVVTKSTPAIHKDKERWDRDAERTWRDKKARFSRDIKPHRASIFDFGCGDGRTLPLFQEFAEGLSRQGSTLRIKAYDISTAGITAYERRLKAAGFKQMSEDDLVRIYDDPDLTHLKKHGVFRKDNLEVELLSGAPTTTPEELGEDVGPVDITTVFFGSLSHVFPSESRDDFLRMIVGITKNHIAMTVPGKALFLENQKSKKLFATELRLGDGEILYHPEGLPDQYLLPYALYDANSLRAHLRRANVDVDAADILISAYKFRPPVASKYKVVDVIDNAAARALTQLMRSCPRVAAALPDRVTRSVYYGVVAEGKAPDTSVGLATVSLAGATTGATRGKKAKQH